MIKRAPLVAFALSLSITSAGARSEAAGSWASSAPLAPVEQRVAIAVGPSRTTIWTSLRLSQSSPGAVAILAPAPEGTALDLSSDAWFEALEVATAPRIFPPAGLDATCPGAPPAPPSLFEIEGHVEHTPSLKVQDIAVLDGIADVTNWASAAGLTLTPATESALASHGSGRYVALLFQAPEGASLTPTLRLSMPGAPPLLPLSLVRAGADALDVSTWTIGAGRARLSGSDDAVVPSLGLAWDAATQTSDYRDDRDDALAAGGPSAVLLESAGPEALGTSTSIASGKASIDSVLVSFFDRASSYGDAMEDTSACVLKAASTLSSSSPVGSVCPRAHLGVIGASEACVEPSTPGALDPSTLRCGGLADDLAVALSEMVPSETWLTRQTLQIPAGKAGADWFLTFTGGEAVSPVRVAGSVDLAGCEGGSSSSSSGSVTFDDEDAGAGSSGSPGSGSSGSGSLGSGSSGSGSSGSGSSGSGSSDPDFDASALASVDLSGCSCSGTSDTAFDDGGSGCDGSTDTSSAESCDGSTDTSTAESCDGSSGSEGADACSGDSADASGCDGSTGGGEDVSCDASGGGAEAECSVFRTSAKRARAPKVSIMAMLAVALIAPLRRRGRATRSRDRRVAR
jgi:hypothetical protein